MRGLFTEHPAAVGETYFQHLYHASGFGLRMTLGGVACLLHAVFPFLFVTTGSRAVQQLHDRMVVDRHPRRPIAGHPRQRGR